MFRPDEIADNLREHGSFIPGIRPGRPRPPSTSRARADARDSGWRRFPGSHRRSSRTSSRRNIPGLQGNLAYFLGGTSVLIVVGVALDLVDRLNASVSMIEELRRLGGGMRVQIKKAVANSRPGRVLPRRAAPGPRPVRET